MRELSEKIALFLRLLESHSRKNISSRKRTGREASEAGDASTIKSILKGEGKKLSLNWGKEKGSAVTLYEEDALTDESQGQLGTKQRLLSG